VDASRVDRDAPIRTRDPSGGRLGRWFRFTLAHQGSDPATDLKERL